MENKIMLIKKVENIFICQSQYHEKDIPKGARFFWHPSKDQCTRKSCIPCKLEQFKVWWTDNIENAFKLMEWADNPTKEYLEAEKEKREQSLEMSKKASSNFSVKVPDGLKLYPFQIAGVEFMSQRDNTLLADEMGLGKEQPIDSNILTPNGWTKMENVKTGNVIIGSQGTPIQIKKIFPQGLKDVYKITFRDKTFVECGLNHLWKILSIKNGKRDGWRLKTTKDLITLGITTVKGDNKWKIPLIKPCQFSEKKLPVDPYFLGVLIGDGSLTSTSIITTISINDSDIIDYIAQRGYNFSSKKMKTGCYALTYPNNDQNNHILYMIRNLNLNVKSKEKFIPEIYKWGSIKQRLDLLRGLMDTDGSCRKNRTTFHTCSEQLANDVAYIVQSLGGVAIKRIYDRSHENKPTDYQVNVKMNVCPFYTKRKKQQWKPSCKANSPKRSISSIEYIGKKECQCISVDAKDGLYITDNFTVTHNSIETIGYININNFNKIIIICPNTLKLNWKNELEKWLIKNYKIEIAESNLNSNIPEDTNIIIINYDILLDSQKKKETGSVELRPELKQDFDLLVADEIHKCKNNKTLRAKLFYKIKARKKIYLTGTPILNKVGELFYIINSLDSQTFPNRWKFLHQFTNFYHNGYGYVSEGGKNLDKLNRLLRSTIMIRRLKKDVLKELPPKTRQIIEIPANELGSIIEKEQQTLATYEELLTRLKADLELSKLSDDPEEYRQAVKNLKMASGIAFTEIAKIRHETALAKLSLVIDYIKDLLEEHDKIVIFAHHRDIIQTIFNNFKEIAAYITGECNIQHRQDAIDKFQNDPKVKIFIGSIQAAGVGITLTASNFVLFVELDWVPSNMEQAIDRLHRIGATNSVLAQYFVLQDSIDAKMAKTIVEKQELIEKALGDVEIEIEKDEPIIPIEGITTTKQRVKEEAKLITPEQINHIIQGLKIIAGMDSDRASMKNDVGFSKVDTYIGNSLAQLDNLTNKQAALGRKLLLKYWRQLPEQIINNIKILKGN